MRGSGRSPALAAGLSFLWPGLGQLYVGRRLLAAVFAIPTFLIFVMLLLQLRQGFLVLGAKLLTQPAYAIPVVFAIVVAGTLRLAAVIDAFRCGIPNPTRRVLERGILTALVLTVVLTHSAAGYGVWYFNHEGQQLFEDKPQLIEQPTAPPSLLPGETKAPSTATPAPPTIPPITSRVTILFTGVDADPTPPGAPLRLDHGRQLRPQDQFGRHGQRAER